MTDAVFFYVPKSAGSPYINHFLQPDTIIPDYTNPQAFNRYAYVLNSPIGYNDPSGHNVDCGMGETCPVGTTVGQPKNGGGKSGSSGGDGGDGEDRKKDDNANLIDSIVNAYETSWQNFGQSWNIWTNPNASYGQRFGAGMYMSYWTGAHTMLAVGTIILVGESLVPGSMTCMMALECTNTVFWSGGDAAKSKAAEFAKSINGVTLEQTMPGRILNSITNAKNFSTLKPAWEFLSQRFANSASGPVNIFVHYPELNPSGILIRTELNLLGSNPSVPLINIYSVP